MVQKIRRILWITLRENKVGCCAGGSPNVHTTIGMRILLHWDETVSLPWFGMLQHVQFHNRSQVREKYFGPLPLRKGTLI